MLLCKVIQKLCKHYNDQRKRTKNAEKEHASTLRAEAVQQRQQQSVEQHAANQRTAGTDQILSPCDRLSAGCHYGAKGQRNHSREHAHGHQHQIPCQHDLPAADRQCQTI